MPKFNEKNDIIVCNSGPLVALAGIGHLELLQKLYKEVLIPEFENYWNWRYFVKSQKEWIY